MNSILKTPSKLLATLGLCLGAWADLHAETVDFEFQAGQSEVATDKFQEIDKRGYALGLMALKTVSLPFGDFSLGLGAMTSRVEGKKASRGITQDLTVSLLELDLRYLYTVYPSFSMGPVLRGYFGRGAKYSVQNNDDIDFLFAPGVMLRYAFPSLAYQPAVTLHYSHDVNIAKREVQTILLGIAITTSFGEAETQAAAPVPTSPTSLREAGVLSTSVESSPEPTPAVVEIKPIPEPLPPAAEGKTPEFIEPLIFNFAPNSTRLNGISRERAKALANVLVANQDAWSKIWVSGHSDKSGDPQVNIALSKKRTDAFCDTLAKRGVPRKKMRCEAMGFQKLIPGLPENAEEHRRIEVVFEDLAPQALEGLKRDIQKALQL